VRAAALPPLIAAALAVGCGAPPPEHAPDAAAPPVTAALARAETIELPSSFDAGGTVRARTTAAIASRILAPVVEVRVRAGDRVRSGTVLISLDGRAIAADRARSEASLASAVEGARAAEAEVQTAESAAALARTTLQRVRTLREKRSATEQELDQAVSAADAAQAQLHSARARSQAANAAREAARAASEGAAISGSYATLTAPFDGVVTMRSVDPGSMAAPGVPLLTIDDARAYRLEVPLDESRAVQVRSGQQAEVEITGASGSERMSGHVTEIARIDAASHSFLVKIDLPANPQLRSGAFGRARFAGPARRALTIPSSAAVRRGQISFVFVVDDRGRARIQPVSLGAELPERVEVLAGVREGERVVVSPPATLHDGGRVAGDTR
jgi:RND family efflux transporter MFP subunit